MAKQLYSTGASTALIKGARDLALATTMPIDTTAAQKAIGKSAERIQKYAMAKANQRAKRIEASQKRVAARLEKFPISEAKVPQNYREANDKWLQGQRGRYIQFSNQLENVQPGSDEEYNIKREMAAIITSIENNSDQWDKYLAAKKEDQEEYDGGDVSLGNNADDVEYIENFITDENNFAGNDDSGNLLFFKGGEVQLWNNRPGINIKSRKAAIALDNIATRIIRRGQKFDGTNDREYRNELSQLMEDNPNAVYSLAADDLFGAFGTTQDAEGNVIKFEPVAGGYELAQEKGVGALKAKVLETYMGYLSQVADNAYEAKKQRDQEGIIDDPANSFENSNTYKRINSIENIIGMEENAQYNGVNLNLDGQTREYDISIKEGMIIVNDKNIISDKGRGTKQYASYEEFRNAAEKYN